ncbi:MAG: hypothetical protein RLZZ399_322 [Verrucomicrobiota bacterium]|jgi:DNA-binding transcriptional LysR family regulator
MPRSRSNPLEPPRRYFKELRFRQFRAFREVARTLSFTEAAETLALSKASLWQQVRSLEEELDTRLLRTESQQVSLTEDGALLLELVSPLVESFDSLKAVFLDRRRNIVRKLTVATTSTLLAHELLAPVQTYRQTHADVRFTFVEKPSKEALPLLETGRADLAIIGSLDESPWPPSIEARPWTHYPFVLMCGSGHPLASQSAITLGGLAPFPLLFPAQATNARFRVERIFQEAGLLDALNVVLESSSASVLARFVERDLGVAITSMSPLLAHDLLRNSPSPSPLHLRDLSGIFGTESVVLAHRKGRHLLPHIAEFCQLILQSPTLQFPIP